jgi:ADP-ribose pyrophosphatase
MKYRHNGRKKIASNQRFNIYFDDIEISKGCHIQDFLIVSPKDRLDGDVIGISVLPIHSGKIGLMQVWRHQLNKFIWQSPAGFVEQGSNVEENAHRELMEETGFQASELTCVGKFCTDSGLLDGYICIFIANDLTKVKNKIDMEIGVSKIVWFEYQDLQILLKKNPDDFGVATFLACKFALENDYE